MMSSKIRRVFLAISVAVVSLLLVGHSVGALVDVNKDFYSIKERTAYNILEKCLTNAVIWNDNGKLKNDVVNNFIGDGGLRKETTQLFNNAGSSSFDLPYYIGAPASADSCEDDAYMSIGGSSSDYWNAPVLWAVDVLQINPKQFFCTVIAKVTGPVMASGGVPECGSDRSDIEYTLNSDSEMEDKLEAFFNVTDSRDGISRKTLNDYEEYTSAYSAYLYACVTGAHESVDELILMYSSPIGMGGDGFSPWGAGPPPSSGSIQYGYSLEELSGQYTAEELASKFKKVTLLLGTELVDRYFPFSFYSVAPYISRIGSSLRMPARDVTRDVYCDGAASDLTKRAENAAEYLGTLTDEEAAQVIDDGQGEVGDTTDDLDVDQDVYDVPAGTDPAEPEEPTCFKGGGALGWILCPVLEAAGRAVIWAYDSIVEPFLNVDARLFANDPNDSESQAVFNAWSIFQVFANIIFIILLLVVIFSQLTGVGIDNYGIKKILPKLIISAILINLSYIICQLAVDLSNVLGYSVRALLDNIASGITISSGTFAVSGGATFFSGLVAVMAIGLGVAMIATSGLALLLPLIIGIISALIAVFFLFVLLGVRQAGVVLLVVISPLAFVCYMLPNTKKLFDRWRKMLQGLLIFFPICGLLIGAGGLASKILLSTNSDNFFMALTAMLLNVVPFFFLPMLLKASFAAMGNIGAKISGVGKGVNSKVSGQGRQALNNSRFGKFATRGRDVRSQQREILNKQRMKASMDESDRVRQGAYTGRNVIKRAQSRINEGRAASTLPIWGTNSNALNRDKRFRHMNANGQYDGSVGKVDANMQMQGLLAGNVVQSDSREGERYEDVMEVVKNSKGVVQRNADGSVMMQQKIGEDGQVVRRRVKTMDNVTNANNVFEAHRGGMTSVASQQTFDKYIASMNADDIADANIAGNFDSMRNHYNEMAALGSGATANMTTQQQAETMFDSTMAQYAALGRTGDEAKRQVEQQLGFTRENAANVSEFTLHQMKDEAKRRSSEMSKRSKTTNMEAAAAAFGQKAGGGGAPAGGAPAGGGGAPSGGGGSGGSGGGTP